MYYSRMSSRLYEYVNPVGEKYMYRFLPNSTGAVRVYKQNLKTLALKNLGTYASEQLMMNTLRTPYTNRLLKPNLEETELRKQHANTFLSHNKKVYDLYPITHPGMSTQQLVYLEGKYLGVLNTTKLEPNSTNLPLKNYKRPAKTRRTRKNRKTRRQLTKRI
jgi:hypothetical protein